MDKLIRRASAEVRGCWLADALGRLSQHDARRRGQRPRGKTAHEWAARQTDIALGNLMTSAAVLGVDACPMEGLVPAEYDRILNLAGSGYATAVACALGYRSPDDKYAKLAKVRYETTDS